MLFSKGRGDTTTQHAGSQSDHITLKCVSLTPSLLYSAFVVNAEPHTGARHSVQVNVGLKLKVPLLVVQRPKPLTHTETEGRLQVRNSSKCHCGWYRGQNLYSRTWVHFAALSTTKSAESQQKHVRSSAKSPPLSPNTHGRSAASQI
jgi:hypothetical protein